ncbi:cilia- and flagella-associated protein 54-like isoform X4 [Melanotaenia boesemani]|uniref:cilia- and flagella-associated protein 54-like isoform X4 n=1 Tax=Melanotaenia boesemani TaxID=1250792 RepID=UPI001C05BA57|nr:cilia- and flagella-associated protein 54-like isoform X4 [Melanotaenia boesemani]
MHTKMDLPASYYGTLDKRNPVILAFKQDMSSFYALMKQVASSTDKDNGSQAKGIKILVEVWKKYKHRLPAKLYQEHLLQVADFLIGIKLYQLALWQGYYLHLLQFSSVKINEITDVEHFMACFFPEGFDTDQDTIAMKVRAMLGCALCIFEEEKKDSILNQEGLCKLLHVLKFIRIMMQAFQQHDHFSWQIYNGSLHIYNICRYLMTMKYSTQALEYLLWASISLEMSVPLMTAKYLPLIITLYCAVCQCYYDNQAELQAEEFARRALGKISELAKLEEQCEVPSTRETRRAYREASIRLGALIFKRAVFETRRRPKHMFRVKTRNTFKDIPNVPWPRTQTERMLTGLFDCSAGQFLGILEALWDSNIRPLEMRMPDDTELQEGVVELLSAGMFILSGATSTGVEKHDNHQCLSPNVLTPTSTLIDLAVMGENKISIMSAVRFIKLLFQYKQPDTFSELTKEMLHLLSGVEGRSFRKAEKELALLHSFNNLLITQKSHPRAGNTDNDRHSLFPMSDELTGLADILHMSVCGPDRDMQPDVDLVLDTVLFLWNKVKVIMQRDQLGDKQMIDKWMWCLSVLCDVAVICELATVDCIMVAEMIYTLAVQLERAAEHFNQTQKTACKGTHGCMKMSSFSILEKSQLELLQRVRELVKKGLEALAKGASMLIPQDCSSITDFAFVQKFAPINPPNASVSSPTSSEEGDETSVNRKEEMESESKSDFKGFQHTQSTSMFLLVKDLHLELNIIHHRASLKLLQLNAVAESELLDQIERNKTSKALFLTQKALLEHNSSVQNDNSKTKSLLEEASILIEKAGVEEKKIYMTIPKTLDKKKDETMKGGEEHPPPPPILLTRTDYSFAFVPAPYNLENQVCWYQLCGRLADSVNRKVRLGDCSLTGIGNMVPAFSGECVLKVEGLQPNQKYVFAVAAYNSLGKLLGNTVGGTTLPLLASMPVPVLSTWAHLAQVAFQTEQYVLAKRACRELWSHYTDPYSGSDTIQDSFASTRLHEQTLQHSSLHLCHLFLTSIFIETEINIQQGSLFCDSFSNSGPFIWEQEARLTECERMLVAMDLAMYLNDGSSAVQAVVTCYELLTPLIFHQIVYDPVVQVLKKCLVVLEENSGVLKQKWNSNTSESLTHMIACITFYLSKALRSLRKHQMAAAMMDCGRRLLQEVYDAQLQISKLLNQAQRVTNSGKTSLQLKALHGKNLKKNKSQEVLNIDNAEILQPLTDCNDPVLLYELISSSSLQDAYEIVMKLKRKTYFLEFAALLIQRTLEEGHPGLVLDWGRNVFQFLSSRDEAMGLGKNKSRGSAQAPKGNEASQQNQSAPSHDDTRKKLRQKMPRSMFLNVRTNREMRVAENLLTMMSSVVRRHKKKLQLRYVCSEERVWRSHLNYCMAQAHFALLYQSQDQLPGGPLQCRYSQLNPLSFSLAHSGVVLWRNPQPNHSSEYDVSERDSSHSALGYYVLTPNKETKKQEAVRCDDSVTVDSCEEGQDFSQTVEQQIETEKHTTASLLDVLNKATLHLQRAMVLAHRGNHWTTLQCVCHTLWDQSCRITVMAQRDAQLEVPSPVTSDQLHTIFTPLLVLATDLIMDMLNKLQLWTLYDQDLTEEELESSLHFSAPLDDSTLVDLRWVRTLVLHTLERLHDSEKWESLAHFALLFNTYSRERYALIIAPLLVHAQRRLLERIRSFGGPTVPQPHHVKTQKATGKEITYRGYAGSQLLSGWTPQPAQQPSHKKAACSRDTVSLKGAEIQRSMSLVCVPLDVKDTLNCYRQALDKRPLCLQVLQHSRSLLVLVLAYTQPFYVKQLHCCQGRGVSHSASQVKFSPIVTTNPNVLPCDLSEEDFSGPSAIYGFPVNPDGIPSVTAAYSNSIKYLQANGHKSLRVLALHEMGNLQFYTGKTRAAHSCWCKAVDCAIQSSGVVEKWDGLTFGCGSSQETVKQAGIWGCLQAAVLTAKIAQFILTSDISQRTKCSLLSAHLFRCVLHCSVVQPQVDVLYATHSIGDELFPGVDLFSEPHRVPLDTTVTSLYFICHWLFTTGYYITLLPMLALYLHFVGPVCRDVQRTVEGKILKVRALTELRMFTEALMEVFQLTQGAGVFLPYGQFITKTNLHPGKTFCSNKSLLDNVEVLEDLVNCDFAPEISTLYGPTLCARFNLARIQLVLAFASSIRGCPLSDSKEACVNMTSCLVTSPNHKLDGLHAEWSFQKEPILTLCNKKENLTPERLKFLLLEGASSLLCSIIQQLTSQFCSEVENLELTIESNLLKANLHLQQGHASISSEIAASSLLLLQTSPVIQKEYKPDSEQDTKDCSVSNTPLGDYPRAVEAGQRIGVCLWLRCRLTLMRSLNANISATAAVFPGNNINKETARVLQEGLDECVRWGDLNIQALLMVEGAEFEARRGKTDDSIGMLQDAVSLLSGQTCMPPGSIMTLAQATLMLSDLKGVMSTTLQLIQKLLIKQLCVFGESVMLVDGKTCFSPPGPNNIYLPYLDILREITLHMGSIPNSGCRERLISAQSSQSALKSPHHSSQTKTDYQETFSSEQSKHF